VDHGESVKTERYRCIYRQKSSDAIMKCLVNLRLLLNHLCVDEAEPAKQSCHKGVFF
jgi:hypothetical protein